MLSASANVTAIILAAGQGRRIGQPKWQLMHDGQTFLSMIVDQLLSLKMEKIICIARKDSIPHDDRLSIVINEHPEEGMLSSVDLGIQADQSADGYLIWPVDHPFVSEETIGALIAAFNQYPASVICPSYQGKSGHPIILPSKIAAKITKQDIIGGLKQLLLNLKAEFCYVAVGDAAILKNINCKEDF